MNWHFFFVVVVLFFGSCWGVFFLFLFLFFASLEFGSCDISVKGIFTPSTISSIKGSVVIHAHSAKKKCLNCPAWKGVSV